jgi:hypothetical protein
MKKPGKNQNSDKPPADDGAYKPQYTLTEPMVALVAQIAEAVAGEKLRRVSNHWNFSARLIRNFRRML